MNEKEHIQTFLRRKGYDKVTPKAAFIDMDGTLYDSMPNHARSWYKLMTSIGIPCTPEEFYLYEGRTGGDTIDSLFMRGFGRHATEEERKRHYKTKTELFAELPEPAPMPGAYEMLSRLKEAGLTLVLVTGSGQRSVIDRIDRDYPGFFDPGLRLTAKSVPRGKPAPDPYLKAMELAGVTPQESIVMENAPLGVTAGDTSGAFTIAVTTGPIPAEEMTKAGAAIIYPSMPECAARLPILLQSF